MSYRCLADFVEELGHAGELVRVETEVDPELETAEITRRISSSGGCAILFGEVKGREMPLLTNLLGTEDRICRVVGVSSLEGVADRIAAMAEPAEPEGWFERLKTAPNVAALRSLPPRPVKAGAAQQIVRLGGDVDLGRLPAPKSAPEEVAPAITAGVLLSADADTHRPIAGRYDLQLLGGDRLAAGWAAHDEPARLATEYGRRGERMPIAVVLGGDPAVLLAACAPLPEAVDRWALAGLLREKPIDVVACRTVDLHVPAEAEIVIEGYVDPAGPAAEAGPLCGPTGRYTFPGQVPVIHVTAVTHRANPIFPALVPDRPPHEACIIDRALSRVFLPLVRMAIPELVDYDLPQFGSARHWATISIRKTYAGQSRRVAQAAWGMRQFVFAKFLVVVDDGIDVHDPAEVLWAISANVHPGRDTSVHQGPPDPFDVAGQPDELGQRMLIDATAKLPGEHAGVWPQSAAMSRQVRRLVEERWERYGLGPQPEGA